MDDLPPAPDRLVTLSNWRRRRSTPGVSEPVIIRMASEATALELDRGWRRGFDAIAEHFL